MDKLEITALTIMTKIGIHEWEQKILQPITIDITITQDISKCQDKIDNVIDYDALCSSVTTYVSEKIFNYLKL